MLRRLLLIVAAAAFATCFSTSSAEAQLYQRFYVTPSYSAGYVPHTTTHYHYVPHGNHLHAIPHTTTHFDRVNDYGHRSAYGGYGNSGYRSYGYNSGYGYGAGYGVGYGSHYGNHNSHDHGSRNYWGLGHCRPF